MDLENLKVEISDFDKIDLKSIVDGCLEKDFYSYNLYFSKLASQSEKQGDTQELNAYILLASICLLKLKSEDIYNPFEQTNTISDKIITNNISVIKEIVQNISDCNLKSRMADLLWIKKKDHKMAELAIDYYLESAKLKLNPKMWNESFEKIERAYRISRLISSPKIKDVMEFINKIIIELNGNDPLYLSNKLMNIIIEYGKQTENINTYINLAEKAAKRAEKEENCFLAYEYWKTKANFHKLIQDTKGLNESLIAGAETYVKNAETQIMKKTPDFLLAVDRLRRGIESYRRINGLVDIDDRIKILHQKLLEYEKKSLSQLNSISTKYMIPNKIIKEIKTRVSGKSLINALFELSLICTPTNFNRLKSQTIELIQKYPLQHLMAGLISNQDGKTTAILPSIGLNEKSEKEELLLLSQMYNKVQMDYNVIVNGYIIPMLEVIQDEHLIHLNDLYPIVDNNPFIPRGRELIYAKSFQAGLETDWLKALHLLIPQVENSIRYILSKIGIISSGLDNQGVQEEYDLNRTLYMPGLEQVLDHDTIFDLQALLVARTGSNLRNAMAHGLMSHDAFFSIPVIYLWCLILRLCCIPIIKRQNMDGNERIDNE